MPEIGASLREARTRAKLDIVDVEVATKIRADFSPRPRERGVGAAASERFRVPAHAYADYLDSHGAPGGRVQAPPRSTPPTSTRCRSARPGEGQGACGRSCISPAWIIGIVIVVACRAPSPTWARPGEGPRKSTTTAPPRARGPEARRSAPGAARGGRAAGADPPREGQAADPAPARLISLCSKNAKGKIVIPGQVLQGGANTRTFSSKNFPSPSAMAATRRCSSTARRSRIPRAPGRVLRDHPQERQGCPALGGAARDRVRTGTDTTDGVSARAGIVVTGTGGSAAAGYSTERPVARRAAGGARRGSSPTSASAATGARTWRRSCASSRPAHGPDRHQRRPGTHSGRPHDADVVGRFPGRQMVARCGLERIAGIVQPMRGPGPSWTRRPSARATQAGVVPTGRPDRSRSAPRRARWPARERRGADGGGAARAAARAAVRVARRGQETRSSSRARERTVTGSARSACSASRVGDRRDAARGRARDRRLRPARGDDVPAPGRDRGLDASQPEAAVTYNALLDLIRVRHAETLYRPTARHRRAGHRRCSGARRAHPRARPSRARRAARGAPDRAPGSSGLRRGGVVSYSNEAKSSCWRGPGADRARHGAVSPEVASALADARSIASAPTWGECHPDRRTAARPTSGRTVRLGCRARTTDPPGQPLRRALCSVTVALPAARASWAWTDGVPGEGSSLSLPHRNQAGAPRGQVFLCHTAIRCGKERLDPTP